MNRFTIIVILSFLIISCKTSNDKKAVHYPLEEYSQWAPKNDYFRSSLISLHFLTETSPVEELDSVYSGLEKVYNLPISAKNLTDGTYTGASPYDAYDYKHQMTITVKNGKITDVYYDEVHRSGKSKREDVPYGKKMKMAGTTPDSAYTEMEKDFLSTQNLKEVDAVSGATYSKYRFTYAGYLALIKASVKKDNQ